MGTPIRPVTPQEILSCKQSSVLLGLTVHNERTSHVSFRGRNDLRRLLWRGQEGVVQDGGPQHREGRVGGQGGHRKRPNRLAGLPGGPRQDCKDRESNHPWRGQRATEVPRTGGVNARPKEGPGGTTGCLGATSEPRNDGCRCRSPIVTQERPLLADVRHACKQSRFSASRRF